MACEHEQLSRLASGWFCPDCGQTFTERPPRIKFLNVEEKPDKPDKPKTKKGKKSATE